MLRFDGVNRLRAGQKVRVVAGPFAERIGRLLFGIMGGSVAVDFPDVVVMPALLSVVVTTSSSDYITPRGGPASSRHAR